LSQHVICSWSGKTSFDRSHWELGERNPRAQNHYHGVSSLSPSHLGAVWD
jgi:hypothetical protein